MAVLVSIGGCNHGSLYIPGVTLEKDDVLGGTSGGPEMRRQVVAQKRAELVERLRQTADCSEFRAIVRRAEQEIGARSEPFWAEGGSHAGVVFQVNHDKADPLVARLQVLFRGRECCSFRLENNEGVGGKPDVLALVPTDDVYEAILLVGTNGKGFEFRGKELTTLDVIHWLRGHARRQPFVITGVGVDFIEGEYLTQIRDPQQLAAEIREFCPDAADEGTATVDALVEELTQGKLFLWWDNRPNG